MGDIKGHVTPGSFFYIMGWWWAINILRRYYKSQQTSTKYISSASFSCPCAFRCCSRIPFEALAKIFLSCVGIFGELIANLPHPSFGIMQHATMYFFFALSGTLDLLTHYNINLPSGSDYGGLTLAFLVEGLLFANHLHGRPWLDKHIHLLLVYVVFSTVIIIALEAKYKRSVLLGLTRSYLLMLQGTWFWAVGLILYNHGRKNDTWQYENHHHVMKTTLYFSWHAATHFVILLIVAVVMSLCFKRPYKSSSNGSSIALTNLGNGSIDKPDGYSVLAIHEDEDDSDIEFEKPLDKSLLSPS